MLERLLETGAREKKSAWGATVSILVHGTIMAFAVVSTAIADPPPRIEREHPVPTRMDPPSAQPPVRQRTASGHGGTRGTLAPPRIPLPTTDVSTDVPDVTATVPTNALGADTSLIAEIGHAGDGTTTLAGNGVATDASVDVPVRALADRAPTYPEMLRAAGIAGTVRVRFVVDTMGRAEPATVRVLESSHELFTRSVLASLRQASFTPGEVSGHRVRTLVERSFRFDIAPGAR